MKGDTMEKAAKTWICWTVGNMNKYGFHAESRKDAIAQCAALLNVSPESAYIRCRRCIPQGEYCLLPTGEYGILND